MADTSTLPKIIYRPDQSRDISVLGALAAVVCDISRYRALIWQYMRRDFVVSYRGSLLGVFWKFANPIVPLTVYLVLQQVGVLAGATSMPKVIYVVVGITFWQLWLGMLNRMITSLSDYRAAFRKVRIPFIVAYLSTMGEVFFDFIVRLAILVPVVFIYGEGLSWRWLALPFLLIPIFCLAFGIGVFLSFFGVIVRDLRTIVDIFTRYLIFVSAVIFPVPGDSFLWKVIKYNPMYHFIEESRNFLVLGAMQDGTPYFAAATLSFAGLLFALRSLKRVEPIVRGVL